MRTALLVIGSLIAATSLRAADDTQTLLDAPRIREVLRLSVEGSVVNYRIDDTDALSGTLNEKGDTFAAPRQVVLTYHKFNPLKIVITTKVTTTDDSAAKAIADFAKALTDVSKLIVPATGGAGVVGDKPECKALQTAYAKLDTALEGAQQFVPSANDLKRWVDEAEGQEGVRNANEDITQARDRLNNGSADKTTKGVIDIEKLKKVYDLALVAATNAGCSMALSDSTKAAAFTPKITALETALSSLDRLSAILDGFLHKEWRPVDKETDYAFYTVPSDPAKVQNVDVKFHPTAYTIDTATNALVIKDGTDVSRSFAIRVRRNAVPQYGVAGIWNSLRYPKYSAKDQGDSKVVAKSFDKTNVDAAVTLNLLCNCWQGGGVYPGLQFGVSKAKDYPGIMMGGVLFFAGQNHIAVSAGAMVTWYKDLTSLTVGGPVASDDALKQDLKLRMSKAAFYFGAQYTFQ